MPRARRGDTKPPDPPDNNDDLPAAIIEAETMGEFSRAMLEDPDVRKAMLLKARAGELPPPLMIRMWDAGPGKPTATQGAIDDVRAMSDEELDQAIERLAEKYASQGGANG